MQVLCMIVFAIAGALGEWSERGRAIWRARYPEEFDNNIEGDMSVRPMGRMRKNGLRNEANRWPNAVVPYEIVGPYSLSDCQQIESAFEAYHENTCIRFRLRHANDTDYVRIVNEPGCHAEVGRVGGDQILNLGEGPCVNKGTIMHELMHVLGFMHEQKRYDRDEYIKVLFENLRPDKVDNFKKQVEDVITSFGVPYDYGSITHYSPLAFSKNGKPTVAVRSKKDVNLGQREYLSKGDITKVNQMYNCSKVDIEDRPVYAKLCKDH